ncbi:MAG: SpoIIE family protein phosphatase [Actinobacteria bacterium]|nr:SpoIIE family protein phosphatase [Actinomycetota bacterium]
MNPKGGVLPVDALDALERLPVAVGLVDAQGLICYVNPAAERLYGFRAEDVVGQSALAWAVAPSDTAQAADLLAKLQEGQSWSGRFPITRPDGTRFTAWHAVVPLLDEQGQPAGIVTVSADDAEWKHEEPPLREAVVVAEEANLLVEALLHSAPVGMALFDRSLRFVRVNAALAEINGIEPEAHVGRAVEELLTGLPQEVVDDIRSVFRSARTIEQRQVTGETPQAPGQRRHWIVSYYPVTRAGEVLWVGASVVEVTKWRQVEAERARLLEAEREARRAAEQAVERLARLQVLTGRLAEVSDQAMAAHIMVTYGSQSVEAAAAALCITDGDDLEVVASTGMDPEAVGRFSRMSLQEDLPSVRALRRGELVLLGSVDERDRRYPSLADVSTGNRAFAAVPLLLEGHSLGSLLFAWADERGFTDADRSFLVAIGRQAAQALERARLYDAERRARASAVEASERMAFLAEASRVLSSSLDYEVTLAELAQLAVPAIADACSIHLLEDDHLRLVMVEHADAAKRQELTALSSRPTRSRGPMLLGRVAAHRQPVVFPEVPDALWQDMAEDDAHLAALQALGIHSVVVVPLVVQDRVLGILSLASISSDRRYDIGDVPFVEDLAGRAAVAIDNARSHKARSEIAQTLQRSLLPPHLPHIRGLELAQRYHSMGDVEVGGDFFDVFPAGDGRWGVVMGDVCGKGVGAASLTALARYTVRAAAIDEGQPAKVLRLLNRAILDDGDAGERFCTLCHAVVEPGDASVRVTLACAGHPLPLLVSADGGVQLVGRPGTLIGLFEDIVVGEVDLVLHPGDAFVLYTDGFIEVRSPKGEFNPELLSRALAEAAGGSAEEMASAVDRAVLSYQGGQPRDDMALLILKVPPS